MKPDAQRIVDSCKANFVANEANCSGFVISVAASFGIALKGLADNIVDDITSGNGWTALPDGNGTTAKNYADNGWLVICGLKSSELADQPQAHGHVVVIVSGPLDPTHNKYPMAYWGKLGGIGSQDTPINFAFNPQDRDRVHYSAIQVPAIAGNLTV